MPVRCGCRFFAGDAVKERGYGPAMIEELARRSDRPSAGTLDPILRGLERFFLSISIEQRPASAMRRLDRTTRG